MGRINHQRTGWMADWNSAEHQQIETYHQGIANLRRWGTYLSERAWGTVREDYSSDGSAWEYFAQERYPHEGLVEENGAGLGASHQRYWTALIAILIQDSIDLPLKK